MTTYKVRVKWGKETFPDIELDTGETPEVFRAQVFALTGVQPSRQKLLLKGATVKPDSWEGAKLKDKCLIVMMGSRDEDMLQEPTTVPTFLEDMTDEQTMVAMKMPAGIENLGNTCYLNAVLQCLKTIPELRKALTNFASQPSPAGSFGSTNHSASLLKMIENCYTEMDGSRDSPPHLLVSVFRTAFPRFAEKTAQGTPAQQDANECWTELLRTMRENLLDADKKSVLDQYMSGSMEHVWKCAEEGGDEDSTSTSSFHQLSCHISTDVKYLHTGLMHRLTESITKHSAKLDRDALFTKTAKLTRIPAYLTVDLIRFFYKEKEAINAKILKDVKFTMVLDVSPYCTTKLQKKMSVYRDHFQAMEDRQKDETTAIKLGKPMKDEDKPKVKSVPTHFEDDVGSCNSGFYSLQAVLTHQGRTSSSGHYVAWVRTKKDAWIKCDDDEVTPVTEDDILRLSGGGDWHCAYVLLYGPRPLDVLEDVEIKPYEEPAMDTS